jgi:hypothetical protein
MSRRKLVLGGTCIHGHVLTEENTYAYPNGRLVCKICRRDSNRKSLGLEPDDSPLETWVRDKDRKKTHCPQGHPYDEENTYYTPGGDRKCRKCTYDRNRATSFQDRYGITVEEYEVMAKMQDYGCAICGEFLDGTLHVDHDHITGKVRGLLCNNCNNGLGRFKDNIEFLENAILYLRASTN